MNQCCAIFYVCLLKANNDWLLRWSVTQHANNAIRNSYHCDVWSPRTLTQLFPDMSDFTDCQCYRFFREYQSLSVFSYYRYCFLLLTARLKWPTVSFWARYNISYRIVSVSCRILRGEYCKVRTAVSVGQTAAIMWTVNAAETEDTYTRWRGSSIGVDVCVLARGNDGLRNNTV